MSSDTVFYSDCHKTNPARAANDMEAARKLWKFSEGLVNCVLEE